MDEQFLKEFAAKFTAATNVKELLHSAELALPNDITLLIQHSDGLLDAIQKHVEKAAHALVMKKYEDTIGTSKYKFVPISIERIEKRNEVTNEAEWVFVVKEIESDTTVGQVRLQFPIATYSRPFVITTEIEKE